MTKADIVNEIAKTTGMEKIAVQNVVETFISVDLAVSYSRSVLRRLREIFQRIQH